MVLGYIWFRFEWQFGLGAVFALAHDVILTIGVFSLTQIEFNLTIIAAILTIVGYSLNDTVIVYDRIQRVLICDDLGCLCRNLFIHLCGVPTSLGIEA